MEYFENFGLYLESRKDETCLQFKMNKHFIKTRKISQKSLVVCALYEGSHHVQSLVVCAL